MDWSKRALGACRSAAVICLSFFGIFWPSVAHATTNESRAALVVAATQYNPPLANLPQTEDSAVEIRDALSRVGFVGADGRALELLLDPSRAALEASVDSLSKQMAEQPGLAIIYFSGHGAAFDQRGDVYLLPARTGYNKDKPTELAEVGVPLSSVLAKFRGQDRSRLIIIVDACRNVIPGVPREIPGAQVKPARDVGWRENSEDRRFTAGAGRQEEVNDGIPYLILYSTSPDYKAFATSTFAVQLARQLQRPRQTVIEAFKNVSEELRFLTENAPQRATYEIGYSGPPICFVDCPADVDRSAFTDCAECPRMRVLPSGEGLIGTPSTEVGRKSDGEEAEPLPEPYRIESFAIGVYEVTVAEWQVCVRDGKCDKVQNWLLENPEVRLAATSISRRHAEQFIAWLNWKTKRAGSEYAYRLPTGIEWEYAARAGSNTAFWWGDGISPTDAIYRHTQSYRDSPRALTRGYPLAVDAKAPNPFKLYNVHGNVWEWTSECANPDCSKGILRGGGFSSGPVDLRAGRRMAEQSTAATSKYGFRVARDVRPEEQEKPE
jgi:formylglycine-generating enzyme required for sulfatase activity